VSGAKGRPASAGPPIDKVRIDLPRRQLKIVRGWAEDRLYAASGDVRDPRRTADPERRYIEVGAAGRVMRGIGDGSLVLPDPAPVGLLEEMASLHDEISHYEETVRDHDALHAFLGFLRAGSSEESAATMAKPATGGRSRR
jgi:hypothetical protein